MILLLFLLLTFLAAPSLCDSRTPPLCGNPFPLTSTNLDIFEGLANGSITPEQGSADLLSSQNYGGPREWPRNKQNLVVIQYCYEFPDTRNRLQYLFSEFGVGEWMKALGGEASSATGHGLVIEETVDEEGHPFYCDDGNDAGHCKFSPHVMTGDVVIKSWASNTRCHLGTRYKN